MAPITINMMKGLGYRAAFAGGVEAAASNGGQIMPPVMGAAAFLMAEILGVSIEEVVGPAAPRRHRPGPPSRLERKLMEIEKLPRSEQQFVMKMLDNALAHAH